VTPCQDIAFLPSPFCFYNREFSEKKRKTDLAHTHTFLNDINWQIKKKKSHSIASVTYKQNDAHTP